MTEHKEWLDKMHITLEFHIASLRVEFMEELGKSCIAQNITELEFPCAEDIFPSTPEKLWTDKMHDIYGQSRAYSTVSDFIGSRSQEDLPWEELKPYLLGKDK